MFHGKDTSNGRWRRILNLRPGEIVLLDGGRRRLIRRSVIRRGVAVRLEFEDGGELILHPTDRLRVQRGEVP